MNSVGKTNHERNIMPTLQEVQISPSRIRSSDLFIWDGRSMLVEETSVGRTRVTIKDVTGKTTYVPLTTPQVTVKRMLPTEAEKAAEAAERLAEKARKVMHNLEQAATSAPLERFVDKAGDQSTWSLKQALTTYGDDLMQGVAHKAFAETVIAIRDRNGLDDLTAVKGAVEMAQEVIMRNAERFGSRSTGVFTNLYDDAERSAAAAWLTEFDTRWLLASLEREVTD